MNEENIELFFIKKEEEGQRIDKILADRFQEQRSRSYFQYLIEEGLVFLNGLKIKKRVKPKEGDEIEIQFVLTAESELLPENIPLDIIYEDNDFIVINKPPGMVIHPAPGHWTHTFVNALLYHCKHHHLHFDNEFSRPGIVHRLDKDTSGVMIAAKHPTMQNHFIQMFANRQIKKQYLAVCHGSSKDETINAPIGRHPSNRKQMAVLAEGGRVAISRVQKVATKGSLSLVRVFPETGRTHQIRVHMQYIHTPILGDDTYGNLQANKKYFATRQMLHAEKISFNHPITGQSMEFQAPVPQDIQAYIRLLT